MNRPTHGEWRGTFGGYVGAWARGIHRSGDGPKNGRTISRNRSNRFSVRPSRRSEPATVAPPGHGPFATLPWGARRPGDVWWGRDRYRVPLRPRHSSDVTRVTPQHDTAEASWASVV